MKPVPFSDAPIRLRPFGSERLDEIKALYENAGWTAYLQNDDKLLRAFDSSLYTLGAFADGRLVGFARCVGDGEHIVYLQDLLVDIPWQRRGIGRRLMEQVLEHYHGVRMFLLCTDAGDDGANAFYRALGLTSPDSGYRFYVRP
ncbi:MAG: GNAT family N-acetyltransferase [Oscillospiraceae bacterium]|nr:GNAT family N-acetyltransferase [Oscillospiraceae bacterium]